MRTQVEDAGAVVVGSMDEMIGPRRDPRSAFRRRRPKGPGIVTASGAYVGLTNDFAEEVGLDFPELEPDDAEDDPIKPAVLRQLRQSARHHRRIRAGRACRRVKALIDDPNVGMLFISFPISTAIPVRAFNKGMAHSDKPKVMVALGDTWQLGSDVVEAVKESPAVFSRSSDRMMRAIALYTRYGRLLARPRASGKPDRFTGLPKLGSRRAAGMARQEGTAAAGIRVPDGELARTADEAAAVARRIGYPVVLKAQAAALSHKTEAGGVMLNLADEAALRAAWDTLNGNVKRAAPNVTLDGALVEKMSPQGHRADGRRQARCRLGHGSAAGTRRHLGRGFG